MKIALTKPIEWEEKTYSEIDLDLERLTGVDSQAVTRQLRKEHPKDPVMQPEADDRYLVALAARAARVPQDVLLALPLAEYSRVKMEVQAFLLGSVAEVGSTEK
jgi:hypothetical protein